ncbi:MAG TPA: hypothetical protein PKI22_08775 [Hydrogenophilus thermoluteolus]|nr:hypothetical protein [Hydrogenophilus thermoluteolus]
MLGQFTTGRFWQCYSLQTAAGGLAASQTTEFSVPVQAGYAFHLHYITADYDRSDWTFQAFITMLGRTLFDRPMRGSLFFGQANAAASPFVWDHGYRLPMVQVLPANGALTITVTNGAAGVLNLFMGFHGIAVQATG